MVKQFQIGLVGDFDETVTAHVAIPLALAIAADRLNVQVEPVWIPTDSINQKTITSLQRFAGLWCVPASPYKSMEGALLAIQFARESRTPFLGTCGGFQHAILEYARNVIGMRSADHAEVAPASETPVISPLACSLVEKKGTIRFVGGSRLSKIYGQPATEEEYHCRYGLNPEYARLFAPPSKLCIAAVDDSGEVRAVELSDHPFFIATLFQPERSGPKGIFHPLVKAFVESAAMIAG